MITVGPPPGSNIDFVVSSSSSDADVATLFAVSFLTNNEVAVAVSVADLVALVVVCILVAKGDVLIKPTFLTLFRRIDDAGIAGLNASTTTTGRPRPRPRPSDPPEDGIEQKLEMTDSIIMVVARVFRNGFMMDDILVT